VVVDIDERPEAERCGPLIASYPPAEATVRPAIQTATRMVWIVR
jgi:hypothetical protein